MVRIHSPRPTPSITCGDWKSPSFYIWLYGATPSNGGHPRPLALPGLIVLRSAFELMPMPRQNAARPPKRSAPASSLAALIRARACSENEGSSITTHRKP